MSRHPCRSFVAVVGNEIASGFREPSRGRERLRISLAERLGVLDVLLQGLDALAALVVADLAHVAADAHEVVVRVRQDLGEHEALLLLDRARELERALAERLLVAADPAQAQALPARRARAGLALLVDLARRGHLLLVLGDQRLDLLARQVSQLRGRVFFGRIARTWVTWSGWSGSSTAA